MILPHAFLLFISAALVMGASIQQRADAEPIGDAVDERTVIGYALDDRDDAATLEDFKTAVVRQHNEYRAKYGAGKLTWSDALYGDTLKWANQCKFQHSGGNYGENLVRSITRLGSGRLADDDAGCWDRKLWIHGRSEIVDERSL